MEFMFPAEFVREVEVLEFFGRNLQNEIERDNGPFFFFLELKYSLKKLKNIIL